MLLTDLKDGVMVFGEWIGEIKEKNDIWGYRDRYNNKFVIFAQAKFYGNRIDDKSNNLQSLKYAFNNALDVPRYLPLPVHFNYRRRFLVEISELDSLYDEFVKYIGKCEGFIIHRSDTNSIEKYVRMKRKGEVTPHKSKVYGE